ncbi:MAG: M28 family metallopeptidase, partial [Henriciella sp.]
AAAFLIAGCTADANSKTAPAAPAASANEVEAHVRFLADDLLEGREAGTRGYDLAAHYVSERFRALGLEPGGSDGTYLQPVPLLSYTLDQSADNALTITSGADLDLEFGSDYFVFASPFGDETVIEAPAVFVGYGFTAPDGSRDDLAGVDLEGKIAVYFRDAPHALNTEERAHYSSTINDRLSDAGAVGAVILYDSVYEGRLPFERLASMMRLGLTSMTWLDADGTAFSKSPNIKVRATLGLEGARKFVEATGRDYDELAEATAAGAPAFDMGVTLRLQATSVRKELTSPNVAAILPGSDPDLADEYVVLSAHLDHDGVKASFSGEDSLFNGAMDNASGTSALLEVARLLAANPPKRSVIFVAVTAEEKGLVGSDYFARFPTVPAEAVVANVNLDMPIMTYEFEDVIAFGAERSNLFGPVEAAVESAGLTLSPDPNPELGLFTRSDHYSWVKQGVPAVYLKPGEMNGGKEAQGEFLAQHYHRPSDEPSLLNYDTLARFAAVKADIARSIANMAETPAWNEGDFFGDTFAGKAGDTLQE